MGPLIYIYIPLIEEDLGPKSGESQRRPYQSAKGMTLEGADSAGFLHDCGMKNVKEKAEAGSKSRTHNLWPIQT